MPCNNGLKCGKKLEDADCSSCVYWIPTRVHKRCCAPDEVRGMCKPSSMCATCVHFDADPEDVLTPADKAALRAKRYRDSNKESEAERHRVWVQNNKQKLADYKRQRRQRGLIDD